MMGPMTDDEAKALLREAREGFSRTPGPEGYYIQRERVPMTRRGEVDVWVTGHGGNIVDRDWYLLPLSVSIR